MKSVFVGSFAYFATLCLVTAYRYFVLVPEADANAQIILLAGLSIVLAVIYKKTMFHTQSLYIDTNRFYLCCACIFGFSLGGFSQSELQQFGFNFSAEKEVAITQYAILKSLFYAIGIVALPLLLKPKSRVA